MTSKAKWPDEVPVLTADDIYTGALVSPDGESPCGKKRCLLGHVGEVFPYVRHDTDSPHVKVRTELEKEARKALKRVKGVNLSTIIGATIFFNDNMPLREVARLWNKVMRRLGYTEVQDA